MANKKTFLLFTTFTTALPDFIYESLKEYSKNANGYKPQPPGLVEKLAAKYNLPKEMIYLTAGADEAIQMLALAYGKQTYFFTPTYIVYKDTTDFFAHINPISALKGKEYTISADKIPEATLIFLANPNNPFGYTEKEKVIELIENNSHAIVVIDEVYAEFADLSVIDLVQKYPNLVVLRSFSKSYGMAGNRIACVVTSPKIIQDIKPKTQWSNVSYLSVGAAMVALDHEDYFEQLRTGVVERREEFAKFLEKEGYKVLPSKINCVLIHFPSEQEGTAFVQHLAANNFVVSHGNGTSNVGLDPSFVRISIGSKEEMDQVKEVIRKYEN